VRGDDECGGGDDDDDARERERVRRMRSNVYIGGVIRTAAATHASSSFAASHRADARTFAVDRGVGGDRRR